MLMYQMIDKDKVVSVVRTKEPVIPVQMKKDLGGDTIIIGAILSQLISEGRMRVTHTKIGGSPAYYLPGSEAKLEPLIRYLNEKDRRTAELLKDRKVIRESTQDPLTRVCLRNIKDFSRPLEVSVKGQTEIFWKWYLTPEDEAKELIGKELNITKEVEAKPVEDVPAAQQTLDTQEVEAKPKKEEVRHKKEEPVSKPVEKASVQLEKDAFFKQVKEYFASQEIIIIDYKIVKKSEIDFTINVPTKIGSQDYYCKAKSKKRVNEGDLSTAYVEGQGSKLPIIFLTTGELTKKAKEMLQGLKGMMVKVI